MKYKRFIAMICAMIMAISAGCAAIPGNPNNPNNPDNPDNPVDTAVPERSFPPVPTPTKISVPAAYEQTIPDETTVHFALTDIANSKSVNKVISIADLSAYGIKKPNAALSDDKIVFTFEGIGAAGWCQSMTFASNAALKEALASFSEAKYLRIWIETSEMLSVSVTPELISSQGSVFPAGKGAKLINKFGEEMNVSTGNATDTAGANSSVVVPAGFEGWISWDLAQLCVWGSGAKVSPEKLTGFKLDIRPKSPTEDARYAIGDICFADTQKAGLYTVSETTETEGFLNMKDELYYKTNKILNSIPEYEYCPEYDLTAYPNLKAIWIIGPEYNGKPTKVFAYIGVPEGASANAKVPAVILQHGGGGYAYASWAQLWLDRGYAVIAIGNTGYYPVKKNIKDIYASTSWRHTLTTELSCDGKYTLPPDNDGMYTSTAPLESQWMYHAVCQTIIANNILRNLDAVDSSKIGITGISWGSVITSIAIGYDDRFAFAVPVYGSGYLHESLAWMKQNFNSTGTKDLWDASTRLQYVKTNILWLFWTNDTCFSINSNSKSYLDTRDTSILCAKMNLGHGHFEGWASPEIMAYADSIVKGTSGLLEIVSEPTISSGNISCEFKLPEDAESVSARLYYITSEISYSTKGLQSVSNPAVYGTTETIEQAWHSSECTISGNIAKVSVPADAYSYYIEFTITTSGGEQLQTSTSFCNVK